MGDLTYVDPASPVQVDRTEDDTVVIDWALGPRVELTSGQAASLARHILGSVLTDEETAIVVTLAIGYLPIDVLFPLAGALIARASDLDEGDGFATLDGRAICVHCLSANPPDVPPDIYAHHHKCRTGITL